MQLVRNGLSSNPITLIKLVQLAKTPAILYALVI